MAIQILDERNIKTINGSSLVGAGDIIISDNGTIVIDNSFDPESPNAQSGIAVAEALGNIEAALDSILEIQNSLIGGDA